MSDPSLFHLRVIPDQADLSAAKSGLLYSARLVRTELAPQDISEVTSGWFAPRA